MLPVVALVGRPNVGKSTLFNRITGSRDAIVANFAGLTRDRKYGDAKHQNKPFMVIDTGGLSITDSGIDKEMADQSLLAIEEADQVLFMVDARDGLLPDDEWILKQLRSRSKPFNLVVNKIDGIDENVALADFHRMGAEKVYSISASHGRGVKQLLDEVVEEFPEQDAKEDLPNGLKMAVVGRPNVGKSTLVNRLLGEDRVVVFDMPGTTRDSIYINYERNDRQYTIIDTAGVRRRKNVKQTVEKFSIVKTLQAIKDANVVILMIDATEGLVDQDLHLLGLCIQEGRALVIAVNKWDGLEKEQKDYVRATLDRKLSFIDYAEVHFISALHGSSVGHIYKSVHKAYKSATTQLSTNKLTEILQVAVDQHQPPMVSGRRIKLRYAHAGGSNPPIIVIHGNQTEKLPDHYKRYLEKTYRKQLNLWGTPIRMEFRTSENPYAETKRKRSDRNQKTRHGRNDRDQQNTVKKGKKTRR